MAITITRAIAALVEIMSDTEADVRHRLNSCEGLITYEAPLETVHLAREFLATVYEDHEQHMEDRLHALRLERKFEAARIQRSTTQPERAVDRVEAWRSRELWERKMAFIEAGIFPPPAGWDEDLRSSDYQAPPGWPPGTGDKRPAAEQIEEGIRRAEAKEAARKQLRLVKPVEPPAEAS
jgi:hypothetical protein